MIFFHDGNHGNLSIITGNVAEYFRSGKCHVDTTDASNINIIKYKAQGITDGPGMKLIE
jgi:hypothetical protein